MEIALGDAFHGYYIKRDPFGRDFITAPEVSQIFGELIGLLFVQAWEDRGSPGKFQLVELGPGRGTLMADMMRAAAKVRPGFAAGARILLVETSPLLRATQGRTLADYAPGWVLRIDEIADDLPSYFVANEFFDALPIRQFVREEAGWRERMVALDAEKLHFALAPQLSYLAESHARNARVGDIAEVNPSAEEAVAAIARHVTRSDGVALFVDYGYSESALGDSLQAMKANACTDPLAEPGDADITAHVDFAALKRVAGSAGARTHGPIAQGAFLTALGIVLRAETLKAANPERTGDIDKAVARLTEEAQMGTLFKALALSAPDSPPLAGFPC
jgi:NADH dehydrogenase [ubiquinone] 1 alpha subcomplex assembly factor 7